MPDEFGTPTWDDLYRELQEENQQLRDENARLRRQADEQVEPAGEMKLWIVVKKDEPVARVSAKTAAGAVVAAQNIGVSGGFSCVLDKSQPTDSQ